jgi:hypothetical protein
MSMKRLGGEQTPVSAEMHTCGLSDQEFKTITLTPQ